MIRKERTLMNAGIALMLVAAIVFLVAGFSGRADLGHMASAAGVGIGSAAVIHGAADSAIKRLQARIAELEQADGE